MPVYGKNMDSKKNLVTFYMKRSKDNLYECPVNGYNG